MVGMPEPRVDMGMIIVLPSPLIGIALLVMKTYKPQGAMCSSVVRAFAHGAMGRRIDTSWSGPIELFLVPASAPRLV